MTKVTFRRNVLPKNSDHSTNYITKNLFTFLYSVREEFADKCNNLKSSQITHWQTQQSVAQTKQKAIWSEKVESPWTCVLKGRVF